MGHGSTVLGCPGVGGKAETYNGETVRAQARKSHIVASAYSKKQAMGAGRNREHLEGLDVKKFNFETWKGPDQAEE